MTKVRIAAFSVSIDGFGAGPRQELQDPLGVRGLELHAWFQQTEAFKKVHGQSGGTTGIDEMHLALSHVLLGEGENLFAGIDLPGLGFTAVKTVPGENATHLLLKKQKSVV